MVCLAFQPFCALNPGIYIYYFGSWCFFVHWAESFILAECLQQTICLDMKKQRCFIERHVLLTMLHTEVWSRYVKQCIYISVSIYICLLSIFCQFSPDSSSVWIPAPDYVKDKFKHNNVCWERFFAFASYPRSVVE